MQETKNLNITEILQHAPKGLPLYSLICGECQLEHCAKDEHIIVRVKSNDLFMFNKNGQYYNSMGMGECLLFPSKGRQTWNNWQQTLLPKSVGSVCASLYTSTKKLFLCTSKDIVFISDKNSFLTDSWNKITIDFSSCMRYATHEETDQFFKELKNKGYEWDGKEIVRKQCDEQRWRDNTKAKITGYYIDSLSSAIHRIWPAGVFNKDQYFNTFATKKQAKSALAMARISQIMANDKRFGGVVTDEEWSTYDSKYVIFRHNNSIHPAFATNSYEFIAFHTKEQRDLFLKENEDLVKDYLMIDDD